MLAEAKVRLLYSISEAAAMLGISRTTTYVEISAGRLEAVSIATRRLIPHDALLEYIERLRAESGRNER